MEACEGKGIYAKKQSNEDHKIHGQRQTYERYNESTAEKRI
jgi:hypothetical protein